MTLEPMETFPRKSGDSADGGQELSPSLGIEAQCSKE